MPMGPIQPESPSQGLLTADDPGSEPMAGAPEDPTTQRPERSTKGAKQTAKERPADARDTYSILDDGEVVAIAVSRDKAGHYAWLYSDEDGEWFQPEPETHDRLLAGLERYEDLLRRDPEAARHARQQADNTVDGMNAEPITTPPEDMPADAETPVEGHESPNIATGSEGIA